MQKNGHTHFCAGLGDSTEVVHHVGFCHPDTSVADKQAFVILIRSDADVQLFLGVEDRRVGERLVADFVQGIGTVRD
jgi:hypothetical protein